MASPLESFESSACKCGLRAIPSPDCASQLVADRSPAYPDSHNVRVLQSRLGSAGLVLLLHAVSVVSGALLHRSGSTSIHSESCAKSAPVPVCPAETAKILLVQRSLRPLVSKDRRAMASGNSVLLLHLCCLISGARQEYRSTRPQMSLFNVCRTRLHPPMQLLPFPSSSLNCV